MKKLLLLGAVLCLAIAGPVQAQSTRSMIGINVVLKGSVTPAILNDLGKIGKVRDVMYPINALTMQLPAHQLAAVQKKTYVFWANPDAERAGAPVDGVAQTDFLAGRSTWNLDMIGVTDSATQQRTVSQDGRGVYIAVLDTGLLDSWRLYFPQERIDVQHARCFGGGGGEEGTVSSQPLKWEHDQNSHGTHVTSTILGYSLRGSAINGIAPMATIIPVKVLNQNGSGWSSAIAKGITYVADLKAGPLSRHPVVINMSLGGPVLDAVEKAAIDYAIAKGVIVVASAGNEGLAGMGYPGAYAPVISVAAAGWTGEWKGSSSWWLFGDVAEPGDAGDVYITDFSSRELSGQQLDVAAPGSWVVGPYQLNSGQASYYFLGGTSMASPHVAGVVALMLQKNPYLSQLAIEDALVATALPIAAGSRQITGINGETGAISWGTDATGAGLLRAAQALDVVKAPSIKRR